LYPRSLSILYVRKLANFPRNLTIRLNMTNKIEIKLVMQSTREYANRKSKQIARRTNYSTILNRRNKTK
jgi:hypothetical protein